MNGGGTGRTLVRDQSESLIEKESNTMKKILSKEKKKSGHMQGRKDSKERIRSSFSTGLKGQ